MSASRAKRAITVSLILGLLLSALAVAPAAAAATREQPAPASMTAVGDSITQAASTAGSLGADAPQNSWSTGWSTTVQSHATRLGLSGTAARNRSVSGAKMAGLTAQMSLAAADRPDYLTVLIGGNDVCTPTEAEMTPVETFRTQLQTAMATFKAGSPDTNIYVVSIPRVMGLYELFKGNWWARFIWSAGGICQSLLANPTSTNQADVDRRARVAQRNVDFNAVLKQVCDATPRCLFDGFAAYNTRFVAADVSGDYFHPSVAGQAKLASVSFGAGYVWGAQPPANQLPVARFDVTCDDLACAFDDTSVDDGALSYLWSFGDGTGSTAADTSHTYAAAGTYEVSLTVTDASSASDTANASITVTAAPPPEPAQTMSVASLDGTAVSTGKNTWSATVQILVRDADGGGVTGASVAGTWSSGTTAGCVTGGDGTCSVTSENLNKRKAASVTFTVSGVTHASLTYDASDSLETTITVSRPD